MASRRRLRRVGNVRCGCGKVAATSRKQAENLAWRAAGLSGHSNPLRFYRCDVQPTFWHWTRDLRGGTDERDVVKVGPSA